MSVLKNIKEYVNLEKQKLKEEIKTFETQPVLAIFQVGNNEASNRYIKNKIKDCQEVGIKTIYTKYNYVNNNDYAVRNVYIDGVSYFKTGIVIDDKTNIFAQLDCDIREVVSDGTIIQLPIPKEIDIDEDIIDDYKDVDGFNKNSMFKPATPLGIVNYLEYCKYPFKDKFGNKNVCLIGRGEITNKPLVNMLLEKDMTVTICHSKTDKNDLEEYLKMSDLIICAVGKSNFLDASKYPNKTIIDVGINFDENGKLVGDVYNKDKYNNATPTPGGTGLLTRLSLLQNVVEAYKIQKGI